MTAIEQGQGQGGRHTNLEMTDSMAAISLGLSTSSMGSHGLGEKYFHKKLVPSSKCEEQTYGERGGMATVAFGPYISLLCPHPTCAAFLMCTLALATLTQSRTSWRDRLEVALIWPAS